jgi:endoglucanase
LLAYALLLGAERFQKPIWKTQAEALIPQIWEQEVMRIHHHWVMLPGAWARQEPVIRLNPSYFLPFAWHVFAKVDSDHPWSALISDTYFWLDHLRSQSS